MDPEKAMSDACYKREGLVTREYSVASRHFGFIEVQKMGQSFKECTRECSGGHDIQRVSVFSLGLLSDLALQSLVEPYSIHQNRI